MGGSVATFRRLFAPPRLRLETVIGGTPLPETETVTFAFVALIALSKVCWLAAETSNVAELRTTKKEELESEPEPASASVPFATAARPLKVLGALSVSAPLPF